MSSLASLVFAALALTDPTLDHDGSGTVDQCERRGAFAFWVSRFHGADHGDDDAALESAMVDCYATGGPSVADYVASELGAFGVTTFDRALELSRSCGTAVSWVERSGPGWIAVCADEDGRPSSYRGAL